MKLKIIYLKTVHSTNDLAIDLITKQNTKPTLIKSLVQTKGKGTMGKKWVSQKGNIFISIFFEIHRKKISFRQFAILNAFLIKKVIKKYTSEKITIKWPNDLLIKNKKVCGILQEVIDKNGKKYLIVGLGINTNTCPKGKNFISTSLKAMNKKKINNNHVTKDIKQLYENLITNLNNNKFLQLKKKLL